MAAIVRALAGPRARATAPAAAAAAGSIPAHWDPTTSRYRIPKGWTSFKPAGPINFLREGAWEMEMSKLVTKQLPVVPVDDRVLTGGKGADFSATLLGHCSFWIRIGGQTVLTDPVLGTGAWWDLSSRSRFTPAALSAADVPLPDIILLSHGHYDHCDLPTLRALSARIAEAGKDTKWVVPMGLHSLLINWAGVPEDRVVQMDWYTATTLSTNTEEVPLPPAWTHYNTTSGLPRSAAGKSGAELQAAAEADAPAVDLPPCIVALPAQHQAARTAWDLGETLCVGYALVAPEGRLVFTGDSGYRVLPSSVAPNSPEEDAAPVCPVFAEAGDRLGPFDLGLVPIGAYSPRGFMSRVHSSPEDAVEMHLDLRCRRSVAMHWGSMPLTDEPVDEPPKRLQAAMAHKGVPPASFLALDTGGTLTPQGPLEPHHQHQVVEG